jgi:hypothetical protein
VQAVSERKDGLLVVPFIGAAWIGAAWPEVGVEEAAVTVSVECCRLSRYVCLHFIDIISRVLRDRKTPGRTLLPN